jgi:hypothetical protein
MAAAAKPDTETKSMAVTLAGHQQQISSRAGEETGAAATGMSGARSNRNTKLRSSETQKRKNEQHK